MYAITGAGGNTGKKLAEILLKKGYQVRAIVRDKTKVESLAKLGAEIMSIDLGDTATLSKAFAGAQAVYAMIPPNYGAADIRAYQNRIGESIARAVRQAGVSHLVNLSSIGAHMGYGAGVVLGLHDQEERLNALDNIAVLHLRPGFFMENLFWQIGTIKKMNFMAGAQKADLAVPQIATIDIAEYAAERMAKLDFTGKTTRELLGQRDLTLNECAAILGKAIGKPDLKYIESSYDDVKKALLSSGMSEDAADKLVELQRGFNEGIVRPTEPRNKENTTPTSLESFAGTFAMVYGGSGN